MRLQVKITSVKGPSTEGWFLNRQLLRQPNVKEELMDPNWSDQFEACRRTKHAETLAQIARDNEMWRKWEKKRRKSLFGGDGKFDNWTRSNPAWLVLLVMIPIPTAFIVFLVWLISVFF